MITETGHGGPKSCAHTRMSVRIRPYRAGDEYAITDLFMISSPHIRNVGFWRWANMETPFGKGISLVAELDNGGIIGHYAVTACRIAYKGDSFDAGFGAQLVVHPAYRNFKTMWRLLSGMWAACADKKLPFIFAFPNENIWPIKKDMMAWHHVGSFRSMELALDGVISRRRSGAVTFERVVEPSRHKKTLENIWASASRMYGGLLHIERDYLFVEWRFFKHPLDHYPFYIATDGSGKAAGWLALKFYRKNGIFYGHIVDMVASDERYMTDMIDEAVSIFSSCNVNVVSAWGNGFMKKVYEDAGFSEKGFEANFGIKMLDAPASAQNDLKELSSWDITMSYSDAF